MASTEVVFQELKALSAKTNRWNRHKRLETILIKRNQPLINLGLACYGADKEVFAALYKLSLDPAKNDADAKYKEGLRIGCMSNSALPAAHFIFNFPKDIIGPQEVSRVLSRADDPEAATLIQNPSIARLLEALYRRADMFAQMPEENWCSLVQLSSKNERLVTHKP